jgi:hypothetical protein
MLTQKETNLCASEQGCILCYLCSFLNEQSCLVTIDTEQQQHHVCVKSADWIRYVFVHFTLNPYVYLYQRRTDKSTECPKKHTHFECL